MEDASVEAVTSVIEHGEPSNVIHNYIDENEIELAILGTHGQTDFSRYVMGGVSAKLVRTSPVPVLTVAADLPLLDSGTVDTVLGVHEAGSLAVCVPASLKRDLGVSVDTTFECGGRELAPTGVNVVGDGRDETYVTEDHRLAVNVNRTRDAAVAEAWL